MFLMLIIFILFLLTNRRISDYISKIFIWSFFLLWVGQSVLSQFGLYDFYIPKDRTIYLVAVHALSFYLGFGIVRLRSSQNNNDITCDYLGNRVLNLSSNPIFRIFLIIALLYVISMFMKFYAAIMMAQNISEARAEGQLMEIYGNVYYYLNMLILYPFSTLILLLFSYMTFKKRDWVWIIMGVFLFMYYSLKGGRVGYFEILLCVVFMGVWIQKTKKGRGLKKYSNWLPALIFILFVYSVINIVTAGREGNFGLNSETFSQSQETTNQHFVTYYVGPLVAFDYALDNNYVERQGGYHYGGLTFNSIEELIFVIVSRLGIDYNRPIEQYGELVQGNMINLNSMFWNALYTWCNFFYCDLGVVGVLLFPFLIGMIVRCAIMYFYRTKNEYSAAIVLIAFLNVSLSVIKLFFMGITSLICIFLLLMASRAVERKAYKNTSSIL